MLNNKNIGVWSITMIVFFFKNMTHVLFYNNTQEVEIICMNNSLGL